MNFPKEALDIIEAAAIKYPDDIQRAVDRAVGNLMEMPEYKEIVDDLVRSAVQGLIYECRHSIDVQIRKQVGGYDQPTKVEHSSAEVAEAYRSVYNYFIAGRTLGSLKGEELEDIAESEANKAKGYMFNAVLCKKLRPVVKDGQQVRQAMSEKKLRELFKKAQQETMK